MSTSFQPTLLSPSIYALKRTLAGDYEAHINDKHGPCVYFGRTHNLSLKPSLSLHMGDSKAGATIATAKALKSKWEKATLSIGDAPAAEFVEGISSSGMSSTYSFSTTFGTGQPCQYQWSSSTSWTSGKTAYECKDLTNGVVVARFEDKESEGSMSTVGMVHVLVSAPREFTALLLLGVMIVKEREIRVMISVLNGLN